MSTMAQTSPSDRMCKGRQFWPACFWNHWEGKAGGYKCHVSFSFIMFSIKPGSCRNGERNLLVSLRGGCELWHRGSKLGYRVQVWD